MGAIAGLLNGLFGAGGGLVIVPFLHSMGTEQKKAQATALSFMVPLSAITAALYWNSAEIKLSQLLWLIPAGVAGTVVGSVLLKKANNRILELVFNSFMIFMGIRLLMK